MPLPRFTIQPDLLLFVTMDESYLHEMGFANWEATSIVCSNVLRNPGLHQGGYMWSFLQGKSGDPSAIEQWFELAEASASG